jgi:RecA-family ATPase
MPLHQYSMAGPFLGALLQGAKIPAGISPDIFEHRRDQIIFTAISDMVKGGTAPVLVTLAHYLQSTGKLDEAGGAAYVAALTNESFLSSIQYYTEALIKESREREQGRAIKLAKEKIDKGENVEDVVLQLQGSLSRQAKRYNKNAIVPKSAAEIAKMEFSPIRWIVPGIIAPGLTIFSGAEKLGKSWLSMGIGIALAAGGRALGKIKTAQTTVLYLALEDTDKRLNFRIKKLHAETVDNLLFVEKWDGGIAALREYLKENSPIRFVIIDTLVKFFPTVDFNDYSGMTNALTPLKYIADELDIGIMLITHTKKGGNAKDAGSDWMDQTLGSKAINATADQTLTLKRARSEGRAYLNITGRDVEEQELVLTFDRDCQWTVEGSKSEVMESDTRRIIYDWLKENGANGPATVYKGLRKEGYTGTQSTIQKILLKMADAGQLHHGSGVYVIPSEPQTDTAATAPEEPELAIW